MPIARHLIDEIARRTDIVAVVGEYVALKERGGRFWGLSPFKNEKTPSFTVSRDKGLYYCFSSHKGGTVFNFIMEMENISFPEAVELLGQKVGIDVRSSIDDKQYNEQKQMYELYQRIGQSMHYIFLNSDNGHEARAYMSERGIDSATLERYCIGYAPMDPYWLQRFLLSKGYSHQFMRRSGLFSKQSADRSLFVNRVIFPIFSPRGEIIAFSGRRLGEYGPKYLNSPENPLFQKRRHLFGLYQAIEQRRRSETKIAIKRFYVVEGNIDVLALHQVGCYNVVAPLGTAFGFDQARLLKRYTEEVTLVFDADPSGLQATQRAIVTLERSGLRGSVCPLKVGSDPAEILQKSGVEVLRESMQADNISESFEYLLQESLGTVAPDATNNAYEFTFRVLFPYIATIDSAIRREHCLYRLAEHLGIERQTVVSDFAGYVETGKIQTGEQLQVATISDELFLMLATVSNREQFPHVRNAIKIADMRDPLARSLLIALEECYRRNEESLETLLRRIEDERSRQIVLSELATDKYHINSEILIRTTMAHIHNRRLQERRDELISRIRRLDVNNADARHQEETLQQELIYLNGEIEKIERQELRK